MDSLLSGPGSAPTGDLTHWELHRLQQDNRIRNTSIFFWCRTSSLTTWSSHLPLGIQAAPLANQHRSLLTSSNTVVPLFLRKKKNDPIFHETKQPLGHQIRKVFIPFFFFLNKSRNCYKCRWKWKLMEPFINLYWGYKNLSQKSLVSPNWF